MARIIITRLKNGGHLVRLQTPNGRDTQLARKIAKAITAVLSN